MTMRNLPVGTAYDLLASTYDNAFRTPLARLEDDVVTAMVREAIALRSPCSVLDIGCGTGMLLDYVPVQPSQYVGIDMSAGMLRRASMKHPRHTFTRDDAESFATARAAFGVVASLFGSLSYTDLSKSLPRAYDALEDGGALIATLLTPRRAASEICSEHGIATGVRGSTVDEVYASMEAAGFRAVQVEGFRIAPARVLDALPARALRAAFEVDCRLARRFPSRAMYLNVTGVK
jgi:predicted TPR repeat methyltransferase